MKPYNIHVSLIVLILIAAGIAYLDDYLTVEEKKQSLEKGRIFSSLQAETVRWISIVNSEKKVINISKREGKWEIKSPYPYPVDQSRVQTYLKNLLSLRSSKKLLVPQDRWEDFGLLKPSQKIEIGLDGDGGGLHILLGGDTPIGYGKYLCIAGRAEIYVVSRAVDLMLWRTAFDFQTKNLFFSKSGLLNASEVRMANAGSNWAIVKGGEPRSESEKETKKKTNAVDNYLTGIANLRVVKIISNPSKELSKLFEAKLANSFNLSWVEEKRSRQLSFLKDSGVIFARFSDRNLIYVLSLVDEEYIWVDVEKFLES